MNRKKRFCDVNRQQIGVALRMVFTLVGAGITQGQTWTNGNQPEAPYVNVACSADGKTILGAIAGDAIVVSTNGGQSWTESTFLENAVLGAIFYGVSPAAVGSTASGYRFD
ncbi:MAG TPA: hypothetical protein VMR33_19820 [Candidatus Baltobacteraceae bacterium]|jgi:hypothetical protein|nr:hypothetical protein [Candidatus Baltobacteraceae bacterium]